MIKYYTKPLPAGTTVVTVAMHGTRYVATDVDGNKVKVPGHRRKEAFEASCAIAEIEAEKNFRIFFFKIYLAFFSRKNFQNFFGSL